MIDLVGPCEVDDRRGGIGRSENMEREPVRVRAKRVRPVLEFNQLLHMEISPLFVDVYVDANM